MSLELQEATVRLLTELRSSTWKELYEKAKRSNIPEEDCEKFIDFLYQKKGSQTLYIPKNIAREIGLTGDHSNVIYMTWMDRQISDDNFLKLYNIWYKNISDFENTSNKRAKIDLDKGLLVARETLFNILGKDYMVKNDKRPSIVWKDLGDHTLGQCVNANGIKPEIGMHIAFQYSDDLVDDYFMNTLIHEYIHSLKSCVNYGHDGEWERVANLVSDNTNYNISQYASGTESEAFRIAKEKMKES